MISRARSGGFTVQSDFARKHAAAVAKAASLSYITSHYLDTANDYRAAFGNVWYVTRAGMLLLESNHVLSS